MGSNSIKIPTILGLSVLLIGLGVGIILTSQNQILKSRAGVSQTPKEITVTNINDTTASIHWMTDQETTGFITAGPSAGLGLTFNDERDKKGLSPHKIHFVTLNNLSPLTTYYFKVNSGSTASGEVLTFTTSATIPPSGVQPLIGAVVDNATAVSEALVTLDLPGAQKLSTVTKSAGNFILPLSNLKNSSLSENVNLESTPTGKLTIFNTDKTSKILLALPLRTPLPPITLGQDLDLSTLPPTPTPDLAKFDLNKDGIVNALDVSSLIKNFGLLRSEASRTPKLKAVDLNNDGVVDQKDLDLLNQHIANSR